MVDSLHAMKSRKFKVKTSKVSLIQFSDSCQLKKYPEISPKLGYGQG